jgi:Tetratricopeptide repeat
MRFAIALGLLLLAAVGHAAPVGPERARAKVLYDSGITHYNLSEFADALKDFKEAYRLVKDPVLLFNLAQCERQLKDYEEAARLFRAYRREYANAPNRYEVDRLIKQMDDAIAEDRNKQPPTGTMSTPPNPSPVPDKVEPAPAATTPAPTEVTATAPPKPSEKKRTWIWGVVGAVGAVVVAGVVVGAVLGTEKSSLPPKLMDVHF